MAKARLGSVLSSFSGGVGGLVVLDGRGGTAVRARPTYRRSTSPAQAAVEARMKAASALWSSMSAAQVAEWRRYGEGCGRTAQTAFVALATKLLMIDPQAAVPLAPPVRGFVADDVAVSASPSFHSGERKGTGDGESGTPPTPSLTVFHARARSHPFVPQGEPSFGVLFTATGPNRAGTVTELLLQTLPNERRSPTKRYGSAGFVQFTAAAPTHLLPLAPGSYAVGYRFIEKDTGQQGPTILLGVVRV